MDATTRKRVSNLQPGDVFRSSKFPEWILWEYVSQRPDKILYGVRIVTAHVFGGSPATTMTSHVFEPDDLVEVVQ